VVKERPRTSFVINKKSPTGCSLKDGQISLANFSPTDTYLFTWYKDGVIIAGQNSNTITNIAAGSYRVLIRSSTSCDSIANINLIAEGVIKPNIEVKPTNVFCDNLNSGAISIEVKANSGIKPTDYRLKIIGTPDIEVQAGTIASIRTSATNALISDLGAGVYTLELTEGNSGCKFISNPINITVQPRSFVSIIPPVTICEGLTVTLQAQNTAGTIFWNTGASTPAINVTTAGTYSVTITDITGKCVSFARTPVLFFAKPIVTIFGLNNFCSSTKSVQLLATPANGTWSGANISPTGLYTPPSVAGNDLITYQATNSNTCVGLNTKTLLISQSPIIDLGADQMVCKDAPAFSIGVNPVTGYTYTWNNGSNTSKIIPDNSGKYTLTAINGVCRTTDDINITILPLPTINLKSEIPLCVANLSKITGYSVTLDAGSGTGQTYTWLPTGQNSRSISVTTVGTYSVTVRSAAGCTNNAITNVIDKCEPTVIVPNIFTPNNDPYNNNLQVFTDYISEFNLAIYNRWGELIFTSKNPSDRWDGKYKGELVKPDSFAWQITYTAQYFPERGKITKEGAVTVAW
jgi:gliding motility-associated-like protein